MLRYRDRLDFPLPTLISLLSRDSFIAKRIAAATAASPLLLQTAERIARVGFSFDVPRLI